MTDLTGSICIRCGFEPLQSEEDEWWCPECWSSGSIVTPTTSRSLPDALLADCRDIVNVQRAQLRALRAGAAREGLFILPSEEGNARFAALAREATTVELREGAI